MYYSSDVVCANCGFINKIVRTDNFNRKMYHTYKAECLSCREYVTFIEIGDAALTKKKLEYKKELNEIEQLVYNLLEEPKSKVKTK